MSNATNDKLNETLDKMGAMDSEKLGPAVSGKKSSDIGFYMVMLLIVTAAAVYIYQDASKRYGGVTTSSTAQSQAEPTAPAHQPQVMHPAVTQPETIQHETYQSEPKITEQAAASDASGAEKETLNLKEKVSHMVDKVKSFVTLGDDKSEAAKSKSTSETAASHDTDTAAAAVNASAAAEQQPAAVQLNRAPAPAPQQMQAASVQPEAAAPISEMKAEEAPSATVEAETTLKQKMNNMVDKVKGLVDLGSNSDKQPAEAAQTETDQQIQPVSRDYQTSGPSAANAYGPRSYQGNIPPAYYGRGPGNYRDPYGSYQANSAPYQQSDYGNYPYQSQPDPRYQPYQNRYDNRYDNSYYNRDYGYPYPPSQPYQQGPAY